MPFGELGKPSISASSYLADYWVGWYESGKRKAKALPSKELAEHYKYTKYTQLNSDVFTGPVSVDQVIVFLLSC